MIEQFLSQSGYLPVIRLKRLISAKVMSFIMLLAAVAVVLTAVAYFYFSSNTYLAWTKIFSSVFLVTCVYQMFVSHQQQERFIERTDFERWKTSGELGRLFSFRLAEILYWSTNGNSFSPWNFFHHLVSDYNFHWLLERLNIKSAEFFAEINQAYPKETSLELAGLLKSAAEKSFINGHGNLGVDDILQALCSDQAFNAVLFKFNVEEKDLRSVGDWQRRKQIAARQARQFWSRENLLNTQGIGKDWSGGFTLNLEKYAHNISLSAEFASSAPHLYGHRRYIEMIERGLLEGYGKVIVVGEPGSGRHTVIKALAQAINWGHTYGSLKYARLLQIDSASILSGANSANESLDKIQVLFGEALRAGNIILIINNFDAFLDSKQEVGRINATEALLPFLKSHLRIIGITSPSGYATTIGKNPELQRLLTKVEVTETSPEETLVILQDESKHFETQGLTFTNQALNEIVMLCTKLIQNLPNPEKSLEILDATTVSVLSKTKDRVVLPEHVQQVMTLKTKIPLEKVAGREKEVLLHLEDLLKARIVGQEEALVEISNALRRARSGIGSTKRPIGSFLFLGPTGVGKTETTKALATVYFGSETKIIRFDMSEFQEIHSISRLIGDADSRQGGLLTEKIIENPFSLILLDEIEKAHPKILDLFLQVLDEGRITDALGRVVSLTNAMIIATSNAGAEMIRESVKSGIKPKQLQVELLDFLQKQGLYRPEFLNRFDAVVTFRPLTSEELEIVAELQLQDLNRRLADKDVQVHITPELNKILARLGFSAEFGARPLRRLIQDKIESYIASGLLSNSIHRGDVIEIPAEVLEK